MRLPRCVTSVVVAASATALLGLAGPVSAARLDYPADSPADPSADPSGGPAAASRAERVAADASKPRKPRKRDKPAFTVGVIPDTQMEVLKAGDTRFAGRTQWLVENRKRLDLRFVMHTGDVVNWGWLDQRQYAVAADAMGRLEGAGIPYSLAIGNHDTRAVGVGGSAYVNGAECRTRFTPEECTTPALARRTDEFNAAFTAARYGAPTRQFEAGKVDNSYTTFKTGTNKRNRYRWLVLSLELWPRPEAVEWARQVVASHPRHNVLVQTHSYLNPDASIYQGHDYGASSPQYVYDRLISQYPNIKMVFSGHVGTAGYRLDTGANGNRIASFLGTFHSPTTNPVRLLKINPRRGTVVSRFEAPATRETFPQYNLRLTDFSFVR